MENNDIENFWKEYQTYSGNNIKKYDDIFSFGDTSKMADDLLELIINGKKRGTTSLLKLYEIDKEKIPQKDSISIVLNRNNIPMAIIKDIDIKILSFNEIGENEAKIEGEGDCSLDYWKRIHRKFFEEECLKYKIKFDERMLVVFETFELIYCKNKSL
ncbi:RNA-binding protein [Spirochaetia bacterium]|nr:RNA-binding protein [Spirochaetia bacterium]